MIGLEYIRKLNNDTCESLAEKIGVTKSVVSHWESQRKTISEKRISEIASLYSVSPEYITKELTRLDELTLQKDMVTQDTDRETIETDIEELDKKIVLEEILVRITSDLLNLDTISDLNIIVSAVSKTDDTEQTFKKTYTKR